MIKPGDKLYALLKLVHNWDIPDSDCYCLIHVQKMNEWEEHCLNCKRIITLWLVGSARRFYPNLSYLIPTYWIASCLVYYAIRKRTN